MANETPKKPIRRVTVPPVSKNTPSNEKAPEKESKLGLNLLFFFLFCLVGGVVYLAIFQKALFSDYLKPVKVNVAKSIDTTSVVDSIGENGVVSDELNTFIGQEKQNPSDNAVNTVPVGSKHYLIAGTFIFLPYAEKCKKTLIASGYDANIVTTEGAHTFYRVYIETSEDLMAIRSKRDKLRGETSLDLWVYSE